MSKNLLLLKILCWFSFLYLLVAAFSEEKCKRISLHVNKFAMQKRNKMRRGGEEEPLNVLVPFLMHSQDLCIILYNLIF